MFDLNRNQFFAIGLVVLFLGVQFRVVDRIVLTTEATTALAKMKDGGEAASPSSFLPMMSSAGAGPKKEVDPPDWLGFALMSIGGVVVLHSLAMPRPASG